MPKVLRGHADLVRGVLWSPDGTKIASWANDKTVRVWCPDQSDFATIYRTGSSWPVAAASWSLDGKQISAVSDSGFLRVWDIEHPDTPIHSEDLEAILCASWSPDGAKLAYFTCYRILKIWDPQASIIIQNRRNIQSISWSPDGTKFMSYSNDRPYVIVVRYLDKKTTTILQGNTSPVQSVSWSPDGTRIASGALDATVRVWNLEQPDNPMVFHSFTRYIQSVSWSPDGTHVASGSTGFIEIWSLDRPIVLQSYESSFWHMSRSSNEIKNHGGDIWRLLWSPDGTKIVSISEDRNIRVWNWNQSGLIHASLNDVSGVPSWSPDGTKLAAGSRDGIVRIWNLIDMKPIVEEILMNNRLENERKHRVNQVVIPTEVAEHIIRHLGPVFE